MDPELRTWLTDRKLANKTLKILEKEDLTSVDVISLLKDDDLQELKTQHSMSVGQLIELRETRDALVHGELTQQHSTGLEHSSHEGDNNVMPAEESDLVPVAASIQPTALPGPGHDSYAIPENNNRPSNIGIVCSEVKMAEVPYVAPATVEHHRELQEKLQMADHLRQQGNTKEATEQTRAVVEGAQDLMSDIQTQDQPVHLSSNLGHIDNAVREFETGNQPSKCPCCCLL
jgi:hypothetical protein